MVQHISYRLDVLRDVASRRAWLITGTWDTALRPRTETSILDSLSHLLAHSVHGATGHIPPPGSTGRKSGRTPCNPSISVLVVAVNGAQVQGHARERDRLLECHERSYPACEIHHVQPPTYPGCSSSTSSQRVQVRAITDREGSAKGPSIAKQARSLRWSRRRVGQGETMRVRLFACYAREASCGTNLGDDGSECCSDRGGKPVMGSLGELQDGGLAFVTRLATRKVGQVLSVRRSVERLAKPGVNAS
ncbi:hypothetical protein KM043_010877 [Ampulex compressa]|nr:hypothetical protein KM043_010877 [Ampulex compressa]